MWKAAKSSKPNKRMTETAKEENRLRIEALPMIMQSMGVSVTDLSNYCLVIFCCFSLFRGALSGKP
jgi:hypothetical protein